MMLLTILNWMFKKPIKKGLRKNLRPFIVLFTKPKTISFDQEQQPLLPLLRFQSR